MTGDVSGESQGGFKGTFAIETFLDIRVFFAEKLWMTAPQVTHVVHFLHKLSTAQLARDHFGVVSRTGQVNFFVCQQTTFLAET